MRTRQKRRILPDTMIQEIGRSVKCQKLNKFINRTPKLSVNKPKARRGDQFPGAPRWLSGYAGTFYPLTVLPRRNLIPRQTHLFPGNARELLPAGAGGSVPWRPPVAERAGGHLLPSHSPAHRTKVSPNPCRKAHRNYSLFPILYSLVSPRRNLTPRQTRPTPRDCQGTAPRRGALTSWARSLSRLRACGLGMSADFVRELLPAGASLFHGDMIK